MGRNRVRSALFEASNFMYYRRASERTSKWRDESLRGFGACGFYQHACVMRIRVMMNISNFVIEKELDDGQKKKLCFKEVLFEDEREAE